jgi:hypothetical protein
MKVLPKPKPKGQSPIRSEPTLAQAQAQLAPVTEQYSRLLLEKKMELAMDSKQVKLFCWDQRYIAGSFTGACKTSA